jgi:hypothetical protein
MGQHRGARISLSANRTPRLSDPTYSKLALIPGSGSKKPEFHGFYR